MKSLRLSLAIATSVVLASEFAHAESKKQHAHDHGAAKLSIAVDEQVIGFDLDTPAQGLYGFEYEPRTEADKKIVSDANARFTAGAADLFRFPTDLGCKVSKAEIKKEGDENEKQEAGASKKLAKANQPKDTHSDMNAEVVFTCAKSLSGAKFTVALIKAFPRIKQIKVQINTGSKQAAETVSHAEQEISL